MQFLISFYSESASFLTFPAPFTHTLAPSCTTHIQGHTLLTRLSGAQPAVLSAAISSHASKPSALSSTNQKPIANQSTYVAGQEDDDDDEEEDDESEEELEKRCKELMSKSEVVLFMKGDRDVPRSVIFSLSAR